MKLTSLFLCGSLLFIASCGTINRGRTKKKTTVYRKGGLDHTVQKGQTIYRIARAYGIDPKILLKVNRIRDPRNLKAGRKIFIPGAKSRHAVAPLGYRKRRAGNFWSKRRGSPKKIRIKRGFFRTPVKGTLTSGFGLRKGVPHDGIDIAAKKGSAIRASASGRVLFSDWGPTGYGNIVIIKHNAHLISIYAHNQKNLVSKGEYVRRGERIALLGRTGRATGPHLHFEIRYDRRPLDPLRYLPREKLMIARRER